MKHRLGVIAIPLVGAATFITLGGLAGMLSEPRKSAHSDAEISEARISLDCGSGGKHLEMRITSRQLLSDLLEEPLRAARVDPRPKRYEVVGSVDLQRKDGSKESFVLFLPWGRYKLGEQYMIADFRGIQKAFRDGIDEILPLLGGTQKKDAEQKRR